MATILITDERVHSRRYLATVLEGHGHQVLEAETSVQARETIRAARPDLVLVHVLAPYRGGYQFVQQLRVEPGPALPRVVFVAAPYLASEARLLARACGIPHVVADVADSRALRSAVDAALAAPPPRRQERPTPNGAVLYPLARRLYGRVTELEGTNAQLRRGAAAASAQLELARSALDREIGKRLAIRRDMAHEIQRLRADAVRDPLTGLYNRGYLEESLSREESRARRSGRPLSMMMIDIDHFKDCNDTFGHAAGDAVLQAVSRCMRSLVRNEDILCRYGGEEFALVMANAAAATVQQRADLLRSGVPQLSIEVGKRAVGPVTLSIGLASYPEHGSTAQAVLQAADAALYRAKAAGRNRVVVGGTAAAQ